MPRSRSRKSATCDAALRRAQDVAQAGLQSLGWVVLLVSLTSNLGCGQEHGVLTMPDGQTAIRLIDHLSEAAIDNPLAAAVPFQAERDLERIEPLRTVRGRVVLREGDGCEIGAGGGDDRPDLRCSASSVSAHWELPLTAGSYVSVRARLRTDAADCTELTLENGRQEIVFLPVDERPGEWQSPSTVVVAAPTAGGEGPRLLLRSEEGRRCSVEVAEVVASEYELTAAQELGILKAQNPFPASDPDLGLAKKGVLLPSGDVERVQPPFDHNFSIEEAILTPAPSEIKFRVAIPEGSRLFFSYGPHRGSRPGDAVGFEVSIQRGWRKPRVLWTDSILVAPESWHWRDAVIDLGPYGGSVVTLSFRSFASGRERALAVWATPTIDVPRAATDPPNILLIAVDTLRADRLGCYGFPDDISPNIDALARDGVLFEKAFAQSNWTRPSFASIFTGLSVESHGVLGLLDELPASVETLAERLRSAGWTTHGIAFKPALADRGFDQGFESYFNVPRIYHQADQNLFKARTFLDRHRERRFFLFLHFNDPHLPYTHPRPFLSQQSVSDVALFRLAPPVFIRSDLGNCRLCGASRDLTSRYMSMGRRMYVEEIRYLDNRIGELIDDLKWHGLYEDTMIVFVSDHGESLWDHYDHFGHGGRNHHDELVRVPLMIKPHRQWTSVKGAVVRSDVRAFDLMPTVLELAGLEAGGELEAVSLVPLLGDPTGGPGDLPVLSTNDFASAVRRWPWRYVRSHLPHHEREQLFNLEQDPEETVDVAARHPEVVADLRLAAAEHVLLRHGGFFVVVAGYGDSPTAELRWDDTVRLYPSGHLGLPLLPPQEGGGLRFQGTEFLFRGRSQERGLALVAGFGAADGSSVRVKVNGEHELRFAEAPTYRAGDLRRILDSGEAGVWAFLSPARSHRSAAGEAAEGLHVDAEELRALEALGYVH